MPSSKPRDSYRVAKTSKRFQDFAGDLEAALHASLPCPQSPYTRVSVLAMHWENDDIGVVPHETELLDVFSKIYGYETESYMIPTVIAQAAIQAKLSAWTMAKEGDGTLRIIIYSGHASSGEGTADNEWYFGGRADRWGDIAGSRVPRHRARVTAEAGRGDVCYILDCCFAGSAAVYNGPEVMCATGWQQNASDGLDGSLTRDGTLFRNACYRQVGVYPLHIQEKGKRSITLAKMGGNEHRVLLSVHLKDDNADIEAWNRWLGTNLRQVKIESVLGSSSTTVALVSLPLEVWTMLDATDEAFAFVAHLSPSFLASPFPVGS
ncbi:hypothetical protein BJY00DRAFT_318742 [Aspergillus carlsbadensis]|nr:hypothetical protein BJY00DRAFT_318742 [Aspergillus carlsbadensis]